jgi:Na+-transporting methylmalonyl-CoA/oxaloacetate decarboxylase beta subunit
MNVLTTGHAVNSTKIDSLKEWTICLFGITLAAIAGLYIQNYMVAKDLKSHSPLIGSASASSVPFDSSQNMVFNQGKQDKVQ